MSAPESPPLDGDGRKVVRRAIEIRALEQRLLDLFREGHVAGTVHTCVGQEIGAAALGLHLDPVRDAVFATHRGHGHFLACGGPRDALLAELCGREGAACLGRGGTQHLHHGRFFGNGIQGSGALHAVGYAWALSRQGRGGIAVAQIGDGTLGEGALYEAFTFAVLLSAPVLFFLEHNGWAQSTDTSTTTPGSLRARAAGFGLPADRRDDRDPGALARHLASVVERVRARGPFLQIVDTRRLLAHSKGDDDRPVELLERQWREDPLQRLLDADPDAREVDTAARAALDLEVAAVLARARLEPVRGRALPPSIRSLGSRDLRAEASRPATVVQSLNRGLRDLMHASPAVVLVGEDIQDPYGGAFKVTRGLSSLFPDRVFSTPIAEAGIVGVANGAALAGLRPVAEIMFGDFVTLAVDQLVNAAAKFHAMFGEKVTCPITCRVVSGAGRGYGPTHSQSLERMLCGEPGLRVVALSRRHDPGRLLREIVLHDDAPTVLVEHKALYPLALEPEPPPGCVAVEARAGDGDYPPLVYAPADEAAGATVVTYGGMTTLVEAAMASLLLEEELAFDYFVVTQLSPLDAEPIARSVARTGRLVAVEEHAPSWGFGAAVIAAVAQRVDVPFRSRAVGAAPIPLPAVRALEEAALPSRGDVRAAILSVMGMDARPSSG